MLEQVREVLNCAIHWGAFIGFILFFGSLLIGAQVAEVKEWIKEYREKER